MLLLTQMRGSSWALTLSAGMLGALFTILSPAAQAQSAVERGKYLVDEVAKCGDCHTPMVDGKPDASKYLKGAVLPFQPIGEIKGWHKTAPDLTPAGRLFQRWGEKGITNFLITGKGPSGNGADVPMPTYKLKESDASDIVEYLKSLK